MPSLLALETSAQACSVALMINDAVTSRFQVAERQQAALILPEIHALLAQAQLTFSQLDAIAFSAGPGSFTGIRLAASVAQGIALSADLPVIPVSTLQILAQGAFVDTGSTNVIVLLNAFCEAVYWGMYQHTDGCMEPVIPDQRCKPLQIHWPKSAAWIGVGDGWEIYAADLPQTPQQLLLNRYPHAKDLVQLAKKDFLAGKWLSAENALPQYLHSADNWKN